MKSIKGLFTRKENITPQHPTKKEIETLKVVEEPEDTQRKNVSNKYNYDGVVWIWGSNTYGQLGDVKENNIGRPQPIISLSDRKVVEVACGMFHTACLFSNGSVLTWGRNVELQLGRKNVNNVDNQNMFTSTPQQIDLPQNTFATSISAGKYHTTILDDNGRVYEVGRDKLLTEIKLHDPIKQIASGGLSTIVLLNDNSMVYQWDNSQNPQLVKDLVNKEIINISCGHWEAVALSETGDVYTWTSTSSTPSRLEMNKESIYKVVAGKKMSAVVTDTGVVYTWSRDVLQGVVKGEPQELNIGDFSVREISCGDHHTVLLAHDTSESKVVTFGEECQYGQLGVGNIPKSNQVSVHVINDLNGISFSQVSCGSFHTAMVTGPWMGNKASIVDDMKVLLHSQAKADFEIVVSGRVFKCHKFVLAARCPLLLEKSAKDFDIEYFAMFLEFVYCDRLGVTQETAKGLLDLAKYFKVGRLEQMCENRLGNYSRVPASTLQTDLLLMLNNKKYSDITFNIEGNPIYAHKTILTARCEYYRALWEKNWVESESSVLEVEEWSFPAFSKFLEFLYSDQCVCDGETAVELLAISNQFGLAKLKMLCESFIITGLDESNVEDLLETAELYDAQRLKSKCVSSKKLKRF